MNCTCCGQEIPQARIEALESIGGTNKCTNCQANQEAKEPVKKIRPQVAARIIQSVL